MKYKMWNCSMVLGLTMSTITVEFLVSFRIKQ